MDKTNLDFSPAVIHKEMGSGAVLSQTGGAFWLHGLRLIASYRGGDHPGCSEITLGSASSNVNQFLI